VTVKPPKKTNRILQLRTKLKLSQRALAKKVGVSQQHIQRLETSDSIDVGFALAAKLCQALGEPLDVVFPQTRKIMKRLPIASDGQHRSLAPLFYDPKTRTDIEQAGIDMDVTPWRIEMHLRGQAERVDVLLADGQYSYLWDRLQESGQGTDPFVVFEGGDGYRYAVQRKHLVSWHFRFDPPGMVELDSEGKPIPPPEFPDETIRVWFSDGTPAVELDGEPDAPSSFHDEGPLNYIFSMLEMSDEDACYSLVDSAGEHFWFRSDDVALFAAPEQLIAGDKSEDADDELDEDAEELEAPSDA
jgi:transcriptional regulator with XRE-family HTH domain